MHPLHFSGLIERLLEGTRARVLLESAIFTRSVRTNKYIKLLAKLPKQVQDQVQQTYLKWKHDQTSVDFRPLKRDPSTWRVDIGGNRYRAMGRAEGDTIVWHWVGTHADYDALL